MDLLEKGRESEASEVGKEVEDDREQVMILVTDGDPSQGTLDPMIAAQLASEQSIPVYTVGI